MKTTFLTLCMTILCSINIFSQRAININNTFTNDTVLDIFNGIPAFYAFRVQCSSTLPTDTSLVRIILKDIYGNELLVYEDYALIHNEYFSGVNNFGEETFYLPSTAGDSIIIQTNNASIYINQFIYYTKPFSGYLDLQKFHIDSLTNRKADEMNNKIKDRQMLWFAGYTPYNALSYELKKGLFGDKYNMEGWDFYTGGIFTQMSQIDNANKTTSNGTLVESFDWRRKHNANSSTSPYFDGDPDYFYEWWGDNTGSHEGWIHELGNGWMTGTKNQMHYGRCINGCYAFATIATVEAIANLYFNRHLNYDLSEQEAVSCGRDYLSAGDCYYGGEPDSIASYIKRYGISNEDCFVWYDTMKTCSVKCSNPLYNLKISGYTNFFSINNSWTHIVSLADKVKLKKNLIEYGPHQIGLNGHSMCLVGYGKIKEGQLIHCGNGWSPSIIVQQGNPLIDATYWIMKNSGGPLFGDGGYLYLVDNNTITSQSSMYWVFRINTPIIDTSSNNTIRCVDLDGDGYYNWGIGPKPATCPTCPDDEDGNDADPLMGPLDTNYYCTCNCGYPTPSPNPPIEITQNTEWNDYKYINKDVIVYSGDTLIISAKVGFRKNKGIEVQNGGTLILNDGSYLYSICDTTWGGITVDGGGTLITNNNSIIALYGNGKVFIDSSSNGVGRFYYNKGSYLSMANDSTYIDIKGNLYIGDSANFNFTGNGYVRFSSTLNPSKNIFYGSGSSITLTGSGQSDKIMEIAQETVFMPNCTLSNGLVYMQHPNARMQAATETTIMSLDNVKFSPLGTTRTNHRGLQVWGNQTCNIANCTFEKGQYGIYGWLSYGGNPLHIENCTFDNNSTGLWIHGKEIQVNGSTFYNNTTGFYGEYADDGYENNYFTDCNFSGNSYPFRYINAQGNLLIDGTDITGAASSCVYVTGNHYLNIKCSEITGATGSGNPAVYICSGTSLSMASSSSSQKSKLSGPIALRLNGAYQFDLYDGKNYFVPTSTYHIYGTITKYSSCPPTISFDVSNNQWNTNNTNFTSGMAYVFKSGCSTPYTLTSAAPYQYYICGQDPPTKSFILSDSSSLIKNAEHTGDWQTPFNSYAQTFAGNVPVANQKNIELWENSWENMRFCLKKMYGLKQLSGISNSEFNQTMVANHKMQQLQIDNYYRLFQLKLEKATLYRMAGNYDKAIELVEELTSDTCASHKEQADAWLCMLQLEKRIAQGLIPPDRIEIERANCPMFQEPAEEQTKSFQNNSSEINIENSSWIKIIPNPASEQVTLCVNSESENPCEVEITNVLGKHIETISIDEGYSETVVPLDKYSKGIYIASLIKNGKKVVIQRFSVVK